ncbi:neurochondrin [Anaeramoeba ignava]|uniref:Neurochondrin n=1 Tax=Anaeramoeba ignava TaxID=1746090 RepID=A0A9Q0L6I1_ANAIG|nr:neurochondrin [Anaeramoeba ignava]
MNSLENCLKLLSGETNEEKFAGLFLVTKIIKNDDQVTIKKVAEAVGLDFVTKLLNSKSIEEESNIQAELGLHIISAFVLDPELAQASQMKKTVFPVLLNFLGDQKEELQQDFVIESFKILNYILYYNPEDRGLIHFIQNSEAVENAFIGFLRLEDEEETLLNTIYVIQILFRLLNDQNSIKKQICHALLSRLTKIFKENQSELKFIVLDFLVDLLFSQGSFRIESKEIENETLNNLREGIKNILINLVGQTQREQTFKLIAGCLTKFGESWAIEQEEEEKSNDNNNNNDINIEIENENEIQQKKNIQQKSSNLKFEEKNKKVQKNSEFIELFIRLTYIEIRLILEDYEHEQIKINTYLPYLLLIMEHSTNFLSLERSEFEGLRSKQTKTKIAAKWIDLANFELSKVHSVMLETLSVVIQFLKLIEHDEKIWQPLLYSLSPVIRIFGLWMTHKNISNRQDVISLIPFITKIISKSGEFSNDLVAFILPGIFHISSKEKEEQNLFANEELMELVVSFANNNLNELMQENYQKGNQEELIGSIFGTLLNLVKYIIYHINKVKSEQKNLLLNLQKLQPTILRSIKMTQEIFNQKNIMENKEIVGISFVGSYLSALVASMLRLGSIFDEMYSPAFFVHEYLYRILIFKTQSQDSSIWENCRVFWLSTITELGHFMATFSHSKSKSKPKSISNSIAKLNLNSNQNSNQNQNSNSNSNSNSNFDYLPLLIKSGWIQDFLLILDSNKEHFLLRFSDQELIDSIDFFFSSLVLIGKNEIKKYILEKKGIEIAEMYKLKLLKKELEK